MTDMQKYIVIILLLLCGAVYGQDGTITAHTDSITAIGIKSNLRLDELSRSGNTTYYVSVYELSTGDDGIVRTFSISTDDTVTLIDSWKFAEVASDIDVVNVPGSAFVIVGWLDDTNDYNVASIACSDVGDITESITETLQINATSDAAQRTDLVSVGGGYFGGIYSEGSKGRIASFSCDGSGDLSAVIDDIEYDSYGYFPSSAYVGGGWIAIGCSGKTFDGYLTSVHIDNTDGDITDGSQLEYLAANTFEVRVGAWMENVVVTSQSSATYYLGVWSCILDTTNGSLSLINTENVILKTSEYNKYSSQAFVQGTDSVWVFTTRVGQTGVGDEGGWIFTLNIDPVDGSMYNNTCIDSVKYRTRVDNTEDIMQNGGNFTFLSTDATPYKLAIWSFAVGGAEQGSAAETTNIFGSALSLFGVVGLKLFGIE